eukprot:623869-Amphidinium_carterae.1
MLLRQAKANSCRAPQNKSVGSRLRSSSIDDVLRPSDKQVDFQTAWCQCMLSGILEYDNCQRMFPNASQQEMT